jgi:acid phosphatase (class A)
MRTRSIRAVAALVALAVASARVPSVAKESLVPPYYYLTPSAVDLAALLAPPPDLDSPLELYDQKKIADVIAERTDADVARAAADAHRSVFAFSDVLGNGFTAGRVPLTAELFAHVGADTEVFIAQAKAHFARPRPQGLTQSHGSYPSGHAAFAACVAILLGEMVPEKRRPIFARASIFAESRIVAGVHYPTDVEAGWISGTVIAAAFMREPRFVKDFEAAKAEVRRVLHLT